MAETGRRPLQPRRNLRRPWRFAPLLALALALLLLLPGGGGAAGAAERQLELSDFQLVARVEPDGSVQVSETLTARFQGSWNGIVRRIPLLANRPGGLEPLGLKLISVADGDGRAYRTETRTVGNEEELRIFVPGAENATRTAVLRYRVANGVRFYADHDAFNWNVTGNGWEIPIDRVSALVLLPEGVKGLHASVYTGPRGARGQDARLRIGPAEVSALSTRRLGPGEGLTLAVGFDKGLVTPPSLLQRRLRWLQARLVLLLPLATALILGGIWWRIGRDPALGAVPVAYEPPGGLPPAVLGSLVQESVGSVALGATLVDLAVKGQLRIEERQKKVLFLPLKKHYGFTMRSAPAAWAELAPHEAYLLEKLFPSSEVGESVDTDDLRDSFYVHVSGFEQLVRQRVLAEGFYRRWPGTVRGLTVAGGLVVAAAAAGIVLKLLPPDLARLQGAADPLLTGLCLAATLALIGGFAWIMPSRTPRGVEVLRQTLGFQEFLRRVDAPRFARVVRTPELFERFLPYAMVAGLTKPWAAAFAGIVEAPPSWYVGSDDGFDVGGFGASLDDCCSTTGSAMQSSPSSSSGSSGGGSSGGGDGGGGGGGF
ncbi:DUF2207 domain-containing protein [Synechococcus sp. CCY 9618]|uniref:DUF2207 domain-containing protein n=1 Tax=Synechococcus sp. CCY 9618 TaxID=2815602 RepID=UPI001C22BBBC